VSEARLSLTPGGLVRYQLKTPYSDGTTHVLFEPLDVIVRLAALVPKARVNLTRFHGVFAPNSAHRAQVTKARRGKGASAQTAAETDDRTPAERRAAMTSPAERRAAMTSPAERRAAMTWAQRLKRVFGIDIETCPACGAAMRIIACIEDPAVVEKIHAHLDAKAAAGQPPPSRAPPARPFG
jgi:pyruvate/2-oxoglutarate dehydrogenase complex dihydrolipoamide acyltransferase (E2) component